MTTVYGSRPSIFDLKKPLSNQYWYHLDSTSDGLYLLASSIFILFMFFYSDEYILHNSANLAKILLRRSLLRR